MIMTSTHCSCKDADISLRLSTVLLHLKQRYFEILFDSMKSGRINYNKRKYAIRVPFKDSTWKYTAETLGKQNLIFV